MKNEKRKHFTYNNENLERQETKKEGGQSGTYLRQMRALFGPRVSVAKT